MVLVGISNSYDCAFKLEAISVTVHFIYEGYKSTSRYDGEAKIFRWVIQYMTRRCVHMPQNLDELVLWCRNQVPTHTLTHMPTHTDPHCIVVRFTA